MKDLIKSIIKDYIQEQRERWTIEKISDLAKKYDFPNDFKKNEPKAYDRARQLGVLQDVTSHMKRKQEDWTEEKILKLVEPYTQEKDFQRDHSQAVSAAKRLGIWDELKKKLKPTFEVWTYDRVKEIALKYTKKNDFRNLDKKAYDAAITSGWYDDVTEHMVDAYEYWTKEKCWAEAQKYKSRSEFEKNSKNAYQASRLHGWYEDITSHMLYQGNLYNRMVYAYEFPDKSVYVGLTHDKIERDHAHKTKEKSAVFQHILKTNQTPIFEMISNNYIDVYDAQNLEQCTVEKYKSEGWNILNKAKTGGLGSRCVKIWVKDDILKLAKNYNTISSFVKQNGSAYRYAKTNGFIDDLTKHMIVLKQKRTPDNLIKIMKNFKNPEEFRKKDSSSHQAAFRVLGNQFIKDFYTENQT